jgi:hypothetical protein
MVNVFNPSMFGTFALSKVANYREGVRKGFCGF